MPLRGSSPKPAMRDSLGRRRGKRPARRDSVAKAVCGFANAIGGYLIIGAEREGAGWRLRGVSFPSDEPGTWISSLVSSGVTPLPRFDVKAFPRGQDVDAVVVRIEPTSSPPCMTTSGVVYQRVSGQTRPVTDQRVLSDLFERGATIRTRTEANALRAAQRIVSEAGAFAPEHSVMAVSLCGVDGPVDKAQALFSQEPARPVTDLVHADLQLDPYARYGVRGSVHQDCLRVWTASEECGEGTTAAAFWDGCVAIVWSSLDEVAVPDITRNARRFWETLVKAVQFFGGQGEAHLASSSTEATRPSNTRAESCQPETLRRWTEGARATRRRA